MRALLTRTIKRVLRSADIDLTRWSQSPEATLLGLTHRQILTILDIGANSGQFAGFVSKRFPSAQIYCFEPLPKPFAKLNEWIKKRQTNISAFNCALGDAEGVLPMYEHVDHDYSSSFLRATDLSRTYYPESRRETTTLVRTLRLDDAVREFNIELKPEVLVKMDVQGFEAHVIKGGRRTLQQSTACLLEIALDELYSEQATFSELLQLLESLGFKYAGNFQQSKAEDGHVRFVDALFVMRNIA